MIIRLDQAFRRGLLGGVVLSASLLIPPTSMAEESPVPATDLRLDAGQLSGTYQGTVQDLLASLADLIGPNAPIEAEALAPHLRVQFELTNPDSATVMTDNASLSLRVMWTVADYVLGSNAMLDDEQARSLLFGPLDLTEESITFVGQTCKPITFSLKTVILSDYLSTSHAISPRDLNLDEQSVQVIKTNCDLPGFSEFLRLKDKRLLVTIHGVFYFFDPVISY